MTLLKALILLVPAIARREVPLSGDDWERVFIEFRRVLETRLV
ncbi:MAG: hypothetical protein AAF321_04205 [Pseudomonadota bacterium]